MRSYEEIYQELGAAELATERHGTVMGEDATFEEGVKAALLWVCEHPGQTSQMVDCLREYEQANEDLAPSAA